MTIISVAPTAETCRRGAGEQPARLASGSESAKNGPGGPCALLCPTSSNPSLLSFHNSQVLFATDVAARGLDFPTVDWVLQVRGWSW